MTRGCSHDTSPIKPASMKAHASLRLAMATLIDEPGFADAGLAAAGIDGKPGDFEYVQIHE